MFWYTPISQKQTLLTPKIRTGTVVVARLTRPSTSAIHGRRVNFCSRCVSFQDSFPNKTLTQKLTPSPQKWRCYSVVLWDWDKQRSRTKSIKFMYRCRFLKSVSVFVSSLVFQLGSVFQNIAIKWFRFSVFYHFVYTGRTPKGRHGVICVIHSMTEREIYGTTNRPLYKSTLLR